jgi:hypothetical protein
MRESSVYEGLLQEGLAKGRAQEAKRILHRFGESRLGPPDPASQAALEAVEDVERLEALLDRVLSASSWEDLLAGA